MAEKIPRCRFHILSELIGIGEDDGNVEVLLEGECDQKDGSDGAEQRPDNVSGQGN